MASELQDVMVEYIGIETESEIRKSISPSPEEHNEMLKELADNGTTNNHHPGKNESHAIMEHGNASSGIYSQQKNESQIPSEESNSPKNGICFPTDQIVSDVEPSHQNGIRALNNVNISNSDSMNDDLHIPSIDDKSSDKNVSRVHYEVIANDISSNGKDVREDHLQKSKQVDTSMQEREESSNLVSLSSSVSLISSNTILNEDRVPDVVIENIDQQKNELKGSKLLELVTKEASPDQDEHYIGDEYVASKELPTELANSEPQRLFTEQVFQCLNSSEMQSKFKEINNLIENMAASSFKSTTKVGDKLKTDDQEDGRQIESEENSKPDDDESTLPKRKSKQSEFEDPEELQLIAKKLKMSTGVYNALEDRSSEESRSCLSEQFRLAYEEAFEDDPSEQRNKAFNFAENEESSKENTQFLNKHLDEIADRVLSAMSLEEYFHHKIDETTENRVERISESSGMQNKREFADIFAPFQYNFDVPYSLTCVSANEKPIRNFWVRKSKPKEGVIAYSCCPFHKDATESLNFSGAHLETCDRRTWGLIKLFEPVKTLFLLSCLFPFLLTIYVTAKLFNLCFPSEKCLKSPKTLNRQQRVKDEAPK